MCFPFARKMICPVGLVLVHSGKSFQFSWWVPHSVWPQTGRLLPGRWNRIGLENSWSLNFFLVNFLLQPPCQLSFTVSSHQIWQFPEDVSTILGQPLMLRPRSVRPTLIGLEFFFPPRTLRLSVKPGSIRRSHHFSLEERVTSVRMVLRWSNFNGHCKSNYWLLAI